MTDPTREDDLTPEDNALGPTTVGMASRQGSTTSTIDDALRDGPKIVGAIAPEIAAECGLPRGWLK